MPEARSRERTKRGKAAAVAAARGTGGDRGFRKSGADYVAQDEVRMADSKRCNVLDVQADTNILEVIVVAREQHKNHRQFFSACPAITT